MKTVCQALADEVFYPIPMGKIENICIKRGIDTDVPYSYAIANGDEYKGALADCLISLLQAVNFSEADKSIGTLTDAQRKSLLERANSLYKSVGEEEQTLGLTPMVYIGG